MLNAQTLSLDFTNRAKCVNMIIIRLKALEKGPLTAKRDVGEIGSKIISVICTEKQS